jgi:hypothetical protein
MLETVLHGLSATNAAQLSLECTTGRRRDPYDVSYATFGITSETFNLASVKSTLSTRSIL